MPLEKGLVRVDTAKLTITYEANAGCAQRLQYADKNKVDVLGWKDDLLVQFREAPADEKAPPADPAVEPKDRPIEVELLLGMDLKTGKAAKVVKSVRVDDIETAVLSPNGQYLFFRAAVDGPDGLRIRRVVINTKGEKVLDAAEKTSFKEVEPPEAPPAPARAGPRAAPPKPGAP